MTHQQEISVQAVPGRKTHYNWLLLKRGQSFTAPKPLSKGGRMPQKLMPVLSEFELSTREGRWEAREFYSCWNLGSLFRETKDMKQTWELREEGYSFSLIFLMWRSFTGVVVLITQMCCAWHQSPQLAFTNSIKVRPNLQYRCEKEATEYKGKQH